jgi:lipid-A-disaccharide synthase-like uncharacterized protein
MISLIAIIGLVSIIIGTILISGSVETRKKVTYPLLIIGGICLLTYSIYLEDRIFIILQGVFIISAVAGLIRINKKYLISQIKKIRRKR